MKKQIDAKLMEERFKDTTEAAHSLVEKVNKVGSKDNKPFEFPVFSRIAPNLSAKLVAIEENGFSIVNDTEHNQICIVDAISMATQHVILDSVMLPRYLGFDAADDAEATKLITYLLHQYCLAATVEVLSHGKSKAQEPEAVNNGSGADGSELLSKFKELLEVLVDEALEKKANNQPTNNQG